MSANLVIVESPAKAKTIKKYLGPDFEVLASYGHVRDLIEKEGAVNPDRNFEMKYQLIDKSKPKIDAIERAMKKAGALYLATDPDREGEAISWHLSEILNEHGALEGKDLKRVRFYEITKNAVRAAVEQAESGVNQNLVNAYKARRALDYLVGFNLSPLLWKKIKPGLSAGRVQSVALRLICEREAEIQKFLRQEYWTVEADASKESARFPARLTEFAGEKFEADTQKARFTDHERGRCARRVERAIQDQSKGWLTVESVERRPEAPQPAAAVHDLDAAAGGRAQARLHGAAHDAVRAEALRGRLHHLHAHGLGEPLGRGGARDPRDDPGASSATKASPTASTNTRRRRRTRRKRTRRSARPSPPRRRRRPSTTSRTTTSAASTRSIWKRAIACQMAPAVFDTVAVDLVAGDPKAATGAARHVFRANGQTLLEPGFLAAYHEDHDEDETDVESEDEQRLPALEVGERVDARVDPARAALHAAAAPLHRGEPREVAREPRHRPALDLRLDHRDAALSPLRRDERPRLHPDRHRQDRQQVPGQVSRHLRRVRLHRADGGRARRDQQRREGVAHGARAASGSRSSSASSTSARTVTREEVAESREIGKDPVCGKPISRAHGPVRAVRAAGHARRRREAALREPPARPAHGRRHARGRADAPVPAARPRPARRMARRSASAAASSALREVRRQVRLDQGGRPVHADAAARDRDRRGEARSPTTNARSWISRTPASRC